MTAPTTIAVARTTMAGGIVRNLRCTHIDGDVCLDQATHYVFTVTGGKVNPWGGEAACQLHLPRVDDAGQVDGETDDDDGGPHLDDHQWGKTPDVWSGALWFGAALRALVAVAEGTVDDSDRASARHALTNLPVEVRRVWPGHFPEYPYEGEPADEHAARRRDAHR